jgi:hypothetical protein
MYCECCSFSHQHSLRVASGGAQHPNNRLPDCRRATDRDANYDAMPIFVEACAHVASFDGLRGGDSGQRIERDPIRDRRFFNCARCLVGRRRRATNLLVISMVIPRSGRPPIACQRAFVRAPRESSRIVRILPFFLIVRACAQYSTLRTDFAHPSKKWVNSLIFRSMWYGTQIPVSLAVWRCRRTTL